MNTCMHPGLGALQGTQEQTSRMHIDADTRTQVLLSTAAKDVLNNRDGQLPLCRVCALWGLKGMGIG